MHFIMYIYSYADVDECQLDTHNCSRHAECMDALVGFTCHCNAGFIGDGYTCNGKTNPNPISS